MSTRLAIVVACSLTSAVVFADPDPPVVDPPVAPVEKQPDPKAGKSLNKIDTTKIEALFDKGTKHYDLGEWDAAIATFKEAYALMPDPSFLFNLGQSYRQKGACREATDAYKSFLRNAPNEERPKVEQFILELEPCVKAEEARIKAERDRATMVTLALRPPTWAPKVRKTGMVVSIAGGALLVVGGYLAFRAHALESDFERRCAQDCVADSETLSIDRRGRRASRNATILLIAGGASAIVGTGLWFFGRRQEHVAVTPIVGGAVVTAGGAF